MNWTVPVSNLINVPGLSDLCNTEKKNFAGQHDDCHVEKNEVCQKAVISCRCSVLQDMDSVVVPQQ